MTQTLKIKYLSDDLIHIQQNDYGNWIDLRSNVDIDLKQGEFALIPLGVIIELPHNHEALIAPRSSTFKTYGLLQTNGIGIVDEFYSGEQDEWKMAVYATRDTHISKNDRICQFRILERQPQLKIIQVYEMNNKSRNGFGSTGIK